MNSLPAAPAQPEAPTGITPPSLIQAAPIRRSPIEHAAHRAALAATVKKFVRKNPKLRIVLDRKRYPLAPVWVFCAACDGVTAMVTKTEEILSDDRLELGYSSIAHAIDASGRVISGAEARCMFAEPDWQGRPSHMACSMAETRAVSKVLSLLYKDVMAMAGFEPTPAEEMPRQERTPKLTTMCEKCDCPNKISDKRRQQTRKKYGKALCVDCEKKQLEAESLALTAPLNDSKQVGEFIEKAKQRKANGGQPVVAVLDAEKEEIA